MQREALVRKDFEVEAYCPPCRIVSGRFGGSPRVLATHARDEVEVARAEVRAKMIEKALSARQRRRESARRARVATGPHGERVEGSSGGELVAEGLESCESLEGLR